VDKLNQIASSTDLAVFWDIERSATLVSRDRVSRGGAIPLEEGDLRHLTQIEGNTFKEDMVTRSTPPVSV
jgi:hypothetical protein